MKRSQKRHVARRRLKTAQTDNWLRQQHRKWLLHARMDAMSEALARATREAGQRLLMEDLAREGTTGAYIRFMSGGPFEGLHVPVRTELVAEWFPDA
jgi:hypothetical protein